MKARREESHRKMYEKLKAEFGDDLEYKPRNILDSLAENKEQNNPKDKTDSSKSKSMGSLSSAAGMIDPFEEYYDNEMYTQMEEDAKKVLLERESQIAPGSSMSSAPQLPSLKEVVKFSTQALPPKQPSPQKATDKNPYLDSDDDDVIMSIPSEFLNDSTYAKDKKTHEAPAVMKPSNQTNTAPRQSSNNVLQKPVIQPSKINNAAQSSKHHQPKPNTSKTVLGKMIKSRVFK
jgi:hypothetical protein